MGNSRHSALLCLVTSAAISVGACSGYPLDALPIPTNKPDDAVELIPNADIELPVPGQKFANRAPPIAEPERAIAEVDWRTAEPLRIMLLEYTFAPHETVLYEGTAYRLILRVRLETLCLITVPCEPPCEESDVGDKNPCLCGGD